MSEPQRQLEAPSDPETMQRRRPVGRRGFLTAAAAGAGLLAGCTTADDTEPTATDEPTPTEAYWEGVDLPDGIYVQPFDGGMSMQGVASAGPYEVAVMYAAPHRFWLVEGDRTRERPIRPADDLHLMASVWDRETGQVVPETGLSVEVSRDGDIVSEEVIYPMLSQSMGFHYGGNLILDGDGTYDVAVGVGALPIRATGDFEGRFDAPVTADFELSITDAEREAIEFEETDDYGEPGAVAPMEMDMLPSPLSATDVPGDHVGTARTDDAEVLITLLEGDQAPTTAPYLAVALRTRYNELTITAANLSATLQRDGEEVASPDLERTLDSTVGYHYGSHIDVVPEAGDELVIETATPPQVARHEGYERAFLEMEPISVTV